MAITSAAETLGDYQDQIQLEVRTGQHKCRNHKATLPPHHGIPYSSINVKPEGEGGGGQAYVGHLTFQKNFWSTPPPWGPQNLVKSDQISHLGEVISLTFIEVVVYILQIIDINCQSTQSPQSKVFHQFILKMSSKK